MQHREVFIFPDFSGHPVGLSFKCKKNVKGRTEHEESKLIPSSCVVLYPLFNFLKTHGVLEASSVFVFRQRVPNLVDPLG
jgi:hypothetical protein